jgi:hypothetical protein
MTKKSKFFQEQSEYLTGGSNEAHFKVSSEEAAIRRDTKNREAADRVRRRNEGIPHIIFDETLDSESLITYTKGDSKFFENNVRSALPDFFIDHRVSCEKAPPYGNGCFALEDIPANILIESAPVILMHQDLLTEVTAVHGHTVLNDYPFGWGVDGLMAIGMGYSGIYNHKAYPNVTWRPNYDLISLEYRTVKDIKKGEQLFIRYLPLYKLESLWFIDEESLEVSEAYEQGPEDMGTMSTWKEFKPGNSKAGR